MVVSRTCRQCGDSFETKWRSDESRGHFCSTTCARRFEMLTRLQRIPQNGAANPNWRGGVSADHYRYTSRFRVRFPEKHRAQLEVRQAIESGVLVRPAECSSCLSSCRPHAHHDDYSQPLIVRWLCGRCHRSHHVALRAAQRQEALAS